MEEKNGSFLAKLANIDFVIAGIMLAILILLTFIGVFARYIANAPINWLEEVQLFCLVWIVFAAGGGAFRTGNHVAIEMIVDMMPKPLQKVMNWVITVIVVAVLLYLMDSAWGFVGIFLTSGRETSLLKIPYALIYGIAIPACADMLLSFIYSVVTGVKSEAKEAIAENE